MTLSSLRIILFFSIVLVHPQLRAETCEDLFRAIEDEDFRMTFRCGLQKKPPLGSCITTDGENAMHLFAKTSGREEIFASLLFLAQADLNGKNAQGETPLMYAARLNNIRVLDQFLRTSTVRVKLDDQDLLGNTALHHAAMRAHRAIMNRLLLHGAHGNIVNRAEQTFETVPVVRTEANSYVGVVDTRYTIN